MRVCNWFEGYLLVPPYQQVFVLVRPALDCNALGAGGAPTPPALPARFARGAGRYSCCLLAPVVPHFVKNS